MGSKFKKIVPEGSQLEKLATGFIFTEGPIWDAANGCLFFSDIPGSKIRKWTPDVGIEVVRDPRSLRFSS